MKVKLTELAKELRISFDKAHEVAKEKLMETQMTGKGKNTWLTPEGADTLRLWKEVPEVVPTTLYGYVLFDAPNPNWVYAKIDGIEGKNPVAIPRKLRGRLGPKEKGGKGKRIPIHAITDGTGTTYRYGPLT
jgi:hypothetical protein